MHEYARPGGAGFQLAEKIAVGTAKTPRARRSSCFFSFPLRPLRLCGSNPRNRQSKPSTKRARIHECARPGDASFQLAQRKSRLEPPRRQEREGFLTFSPFLCALCAFAVQSRAHHPPLTRSYKRGTCSANVSLSVSSSHRRPTPPYSSVTTQGWPHAPRRISPNAQV